MAVNPKFLFVYRAPHDGGVTWDAKHLASMNQKKLHVPCADIFIHHSVTTPSANPCTDMRQLEQIGHERFGESVSYSYAVHPSGVVLEGCAENVGTHTLNWNSKSMGIVFLGDFTSHVPGPDQVNSTVDLIHLLQLFGAVSAKPRVRPHRAVRATECPGLVTQTIPAIAQAVGGHS